MRKHRDETCVVSMYSPCLGLRWVWDNAGSLKWMREWGTLGACRRRRRLGLLSAVMWKRHSGLGWKKSGNLRMLLSLSAALCSPAMAHNYRQEAPALHNFFYIFWYAHTCKLHNSLKKKKSYPCRVLSASLLFSSEIIVTLVYSVLLPTPIISVLWCWDYLESCLMIHISKEQELTDSRDD